MTPTICFALVIVAGLMFWVCWFAVRCYCEAEEARKANMKLLSKYRSLEHLSGFLKDENMCLHLANEQQHERIRELENAIENMDKPHPLRISRKVIEEVAFCN